MGPHLLPSVAYREGDAELPYPDKAPRADARSVQ